jgi:hypothetical protein
MLADRINNIIDMNTATFKWYDKQLEVIDKICLQTLMIIMIIKPKKR